MRLALGPRGLRARIVLGFAAVTLLVSVVLVTTTFLLARSYLLDQREASLTRQAFADANVLNSRLATAGTDVGDLLARTRARTANVAGFTDAYRRYVWPTSGLEGVQLAPFQLLASEGRTWTSHDHGWHLALADRLVAAAPALMRATRRLRVDTSDPVSTRAGVEWWDELTAAGGEGMVVKPFANLVQTSRGYAQPGIKVRGREYLRIIYGADYTDAATLERLRSRNVGQKRSMALREYALGLEALRRAAAGEPTWRVHQCVFAVLAMESEPVDPRL